MNMASDYELLSPSKVSTAVNSFCTNYSDVIIHYVNFLLVKRLSYRNFVPKLSPPFPRSKRGGRKETDLGAIMFVFKWLTKHPTQSAYSTAWNRPCFCDCLFRTTTPVKDQQITRECFPLLFICFTLRYLKACNRIKHHDLHHKQVA